MDDAVPVAMDAPLPNEVKTVIIGAGITGLCTANLLVEDGARDDLIVLESAGTPGGNARTDTIDGFTCDWGPNGFLDREPKTLEWIDKLGLAQQCVHANEAAAHRFIYKNGNLIEAVPPPGFLLSPLLSVSGRARLLCEPFIAPKRDDTPESIWDFAARRIGREAADTLVSCMVSGIHGGDAKQLSLEHCFPRMAAMEREHGSLFKALRAQRRSNAAASAMGPRGTLTTFAGGMATLCTRASERLGDRVRFNTPVGRIQKLNDAFQIETSHGTLHAARVVVTVPSFAASTLLSDLDSDLATALDRIPYAPIAVLCTGFRRDQVHHDLNGFGFLAPRNQGIRALGSIWTSTVFPNQVPEGHVLFRTMYGGATDPNAVNLSDNELLNTFKSDVYRLVNIEGDPDMVRIFRHPRGIPQYGLQHGEILAAIEAGERRHPGLVLAGNAYRGVGVNDCVLSAHRAVDLLR